MNRQRVDLPEHILSIIIDRAVKSPEITEVILFGSRALGNAKRGSDIDLAISGKNVSNRILDTFRAYLEEETDIPHLLDIVHLEAIENEDLKRHIRTYGKSIYKRKELHTTP